MQTEKGKNLIANDMVWEVGRDLLDELGEVMARRFKTLSEQGWAWRMCGRREGSRGKEDAKRGKQRKEDAEDSLGWRFLGAPKGLCKVILWMQPYTYHLFAL
jgi:hypothetical protein